MSETYEQLLPIEALPPAIFEPDTGMDSEVPATFEPVSGTATSESVSSTDIEVPARFEPVSGTETSEPVSGTDNKVLSLSYTHNTTR